MVFSPGNYGLNPSAILGVFQDPKTVILAVIVVGLSVVVMAGEWWSRRSGELYGLFMNRWVQLLLIAGIFFLSPSEESRFIYFNF